MRWATRADHLQLYAAAFDWVAADDRARGDGEGDAAVNQYGGDEQRHDVSRPALAVGDQSSTICRAMMYHAYFAEISITDVAMIKAMKL